MLLQVSVRSSSRDEAAVVELLESVFGCAPVVESKPGVDRISASVYLKATRCKPARLTALRHGLRRLGHATLTIRRIAPEDWAESWKRHFRPLEIGSALLLKPSWSKRRPRKGQAVVVIDPGLSFGTGQHHTTRFCLEQLVALRRTHDTLLDVGTGSGILAISAVQVGYRAVMAIDIDPAAVRIARGNARRNRVGRKLAIDVADLAHWKIPRRFNVVCANLTADVLIAEATRLVSALAPDGFLILAGILGNQFASVRAEYKTHGLKTVASGRDATWQSAILSRSREK